MGIWRAAVVLQTLLLLPRAQKLAIQFPQPGQIFDHGASIGIQGYVEDLPGQPIAIEILLDGETLYMSETSHTIDIYEPNGFHPGKHNVSVMRLQAYADGCNVINRRVTWFHIVLQIVGRLVSADGTVLGPEAHVQFEVHTLRVHGPLATGIPFLTKVRAPSSQLANTAFEDGTFIDCGWSPLEDTLNHFPFQARRTANPAAHPPANAHKPPSMRSVASTTMAPPFTLGFALCYGPALLVWCRPWGDAFCSGTLGGCASRGPRNGRARSSSWYGTTAAEGKSTTGTTRYLD